VSAPTLFLDSWAALRSVPRTGQRYHAMAAPRSFELGDGGVTALAPRLEWFWAVRAGNMAPADYFAHYRAQLTSISAQLAPGWLIVDSGALHDVYDGDTICCSCRRGAAPGLFERGPSCHLEVAAEELRRAGWRVGLWGGAPW
jgi:hypothetical protein